MREVFVEALALAPETREAFVRQACAADETMCREALELLACHVDGAGPETDDLWSRPTVVPAFVGPYEVLDLLGKGGMGVVYRARRRPAEDGGEPGPIVALKVLRDTSLSQVMERRFKREIEVLRRLEHPGIARLLDTGIADGLPYLATEYIDGLMLSRWRDETHPTETERVRLLAELCDAVECAHRHGVVHRDLKPENIVVTPDGHPHVLDFGIAHLQEDHTQGPTFVTATWQLLGTIRYMSPEQAEGGAAAIDERTDIYTLGIIGYELLSGSLPYDLGRLSTPRALLEITLAEPRGLPEAHHSALGLIVRHALEKDPARRYPTAAAMAGDLRDFLDGRKISLRSPGPVHRLRRALRRRPRVRRVVFVAAIVLVAVTATLILRPADRAPLPTWSTFFSRLESADNLRHSGPRSRENFEAAIALFEQAWNDLPLLPQAAYTADLRRYVKWRLGELYYFIGDMEHDVVALERARGYWRDAALEPWQQGSAAAIDPAVVSRVNILQMGAHQAWSGIGMASASLAAYRDPVENWQLACDGYGQSCLALADEDHNYHDDSVQPQQRRVNRALALMSLGSAMSGLGAARDSVSIVEAGIESLRGAFALEAFKAGGYESLLDEAMGTAFMRRAAVQARDSLPAAMVSFDSSAIYMDRASLSRGIASGRAYWRLHEVHSSLWEGRSQVANSTDEKRRCLVEALRELEDSVHALAAGRDDYELARSHTRMAGVTAQLAAATNDRALFARADSLLTLDTIFSDPLHYPLQHVDREYQHALIHTMCWVAFGDPADSLAAAASLRHGLESVPVSEFPAWQRRYDEQMTMLASRR